MLSTENTKYIYVDIRNFYLSTPLNHVEYMRIPLSLFPQHTIDQYNLNDKAKNCYVYVEVRKATYGLPQAGTLANKQLKDCLSPKGYFEVPHTPGLWKHISRPTEFTLGVDDFGVKYTRKKRVDHISSTPSKATIRFCKIGRVNFIAASA